MGIGDRGSGIGDGGVGIGGWGIWDGDLDVGCACYGSSRLCPATRVRAVSYRPCRFGSGLPALKVVSRYTPAASPGMPGPYPGRVVSVTSAKSVDTATGAANDEAVREMMARGMRALTGAATTPDAWRRFFDPSDRVGIKVNCGGYPHCVSSYEIVAEAVRQLTGIGVPASQIYLYERFQNQLDECNYAPHLPEGVQIVAAERANRNVDNSGYDPATYLEADLFGEDDTRSSMMRLVSQRLTKIINIPNMKDHGATGVTGCLKNIAYGSFSNVARTHQNGKSHTYSVVGTLASIEPLRSRDGAADHGRPARRLAWRPVRADHEIRLLSETDHVRHRSGGDRSPAARHHRDRAACARRDLDLGSLARLAEDRRHARARRGSQRQHHHPRAGTRGVRLDARPWRLRPREDRASRTLRVD